MSIHLCQRFVNPRQWFPSLATFITSYKSQMCYSKRQRSCSSFQQTGSKGGYMLRTISSTRLEILLALWKKSIALFICNFNFDWICFINHHGTWNSQWRFDPLFGDLWLKCRVSELPHNPMDESKNATYKANAH